ANRLRFRRDRDRFVRRRLALRRILAGYLDAPPAAIDYRKGPWGKPELSERFAGSGLLFNTTDSADLALIACTRRVRVGVDIERTGAAPDLLDVARRFFSAAECYALAALGQQPRVEAFYRCWTRKEALVKGIGGGLSLRTDTFDVTLAP